MSVNVDTGIDLTDPRSWARAGIKYGKKAVWAEEPREQVATNLVIIVAAVLSSTVTLGATILIAFLAAPFFAIGVIRLVVDATGGSGSVFGAAGIGVAIGLAIALLATAVVGSATVAFGAGLLAGALAAWLAYTYEG